MKGFIILAALICVAFVGCDDTREATLRYRVIATVEIDGQKVEASTVISWTEDRACLKLL